MLHSDIGLFGRSSDTWDTDIARKYLLIPEEESRKLGSIPGWSRREQQINKKRIAEQGQTFQTIGPSNSQFVETANPPSSLFPNTKIYEKEPRGNSKIPASFENTSLCRNNKVEGSSIIPTPKICSSTPGIDVLVEEERSSLRKSTSLEDISCNMSTKQPTLSHPNKSVEKSLLDTTYVVPSVLDDKTNDIQIASDVQSQKASKSPAKIPTEKRIFGNVGTEIPNPAFDEASVPKFGGHPVFPANTTHASHEILLSKKLRLLEKRFSPSKEFSLSLSQGTMMATGNLKSIENKNLPEALIKPIEVSDSQPNIRSQIDAKSSLNSEDGKTSSSSIANIPSSETTATKEDSVVREAELPEKVLSIKSSSYVFEEESFVSQAIPCGQPPPSDQSCSSLRKPLGTQTAIECEVLEPSISGNIAEKVKMPPHVLSEKIRGQVEAQELVPVKGSKARNKRKLKSDNTSRKFSKSTVSIQYTAEQFRDMVEIMKYFQSEM